MWKSRWYGIYHRCLRIRCILDPRQHYLLTLTPRCQPLPQKHQDLSTGLVLLKIDMWLRSRSFLTVCPFIYTIHQSVSELQWEITHIAKGIIDATKYLPHKKAKNKKFVIIDKELKAHCRASRTAWLKWGDVGRPSHSKLAEEKKSTKKQVRQFVASARARLVRSEIQEIACLRRTTPYVSRPQTWEPNAQNLWWTVSYWHNWDTTPVYIILRFTWKIRSISYQTTHLPTDNIRNGGSVLRK